MRLPWRQDGSASRHRQSDVRETRAGAQPSPGLARALERILKDDKPRILDFGPLCGDTAVRLARLGALVSVESFRVPATPPAGPDGEAPPPPPIRLEQDDGRFQLVLAWEHADFVPPDRLREFGGEIHRVLAPGGFALVFARNAPARDDPEQRTPGRYRLLDDDRLLREPMEGPPRERWVHPTRDIERALAPLKIQGLQLHRNQLREFLAQRAAD
jgi:hypothetical protein